MRTELLAIVPGILSAWLTIFRSMSTALYWVYLPVLLLIPDNFRLPIDGLPDPTFSQAAILPIGFGVCCQAHLWHQFQSSSRKFRATPAGCETKAKPTVLCTSFPQFVPANPLIP